MTRSEIIDRFRQENPEITTNRISDSVLQSWCIQADKDFCARARLITGETEFSAIEDTRFYDLTSYITKFYDINEYPGGGVCYDDERLDYRTKAEMDSLRKDWRTEDSSTPTDYFRENQYLKLSPPPNGTDTILVDAVLISDDFDDDNKTPFNQLTYLEPFHYAINLYLEWKAMKKINKPQDAQSAREEYLDYAKWVMAELAGRKYGKITFVPKYR